MGADVDVVGLYKLNTVVAWKASGFNPRQVKNRVQLSTFTFKMQLVPLQRGVLPRVPRRRRPRLRQPPVLLRGGAVAQVESCRPIHVYVA
jgi:hypothetical protein